MCKKLLCLNLVATEITGEKPEGSHYMCPNNQSCTEKQGGHHTSFVAMIHLLQCYRGITVWEMNPCCFRKSQWEAILSYRKLTPCVVSKKYRNTKREKVAAWCLLCSCWSWWKGTSWDKGTLSSEEIKPMALSIVELCLAEASLVRYIITTVLYDYFGSCQHIIIQITQPLSTQRFNNAQSQINHVTEVVSGKLDVHLTCMPVLNFFLINSFAALLTDTSSGYSLWQVPSVCKYCLFITALVL